MQVDLALLKSCFAHTVGRVKYRLGAKPRLGSDSSGFALSDCSGWARWALDRAGLRLPDGSQTQWAWCEQQGLHQLAHYSDAATYASDDPTALFIAFEAAHPIGHVWLGWSENGKMRTHECCGSHGVYSRSWEALQGIAAACYRLPNK